MLIFLNDMKTVMITGLALMLAVRAPAAGDVCPDPAYLIKPGSDLLSLHLAFNDSPSSRRLLNEVHYYDPEDPNLTVGMGHWTGGKLARLFQQLKENPAAWQLLTTRWASRMDASMWHAFEQDTREHGQNAATLSRGVSKLLCADDPSNTCVTQTMLPWTHAIGKRFNDDRQWFRAGWLAVSLDAKVAEVQVRHWVESVVGEGEAEAGRRGITTLGGIASTISAVSSGLGTTLFPAQASSATAKNGKLGRSAVFSLTMVPGNARPLGGTANEQALMDDWRSLVAWQFYTITRAKQNKLVRGRMATIWKNYYAATWGPLPSQPAFEDISKPRRHSGCYMARGRIDRKDAVQIPTTPDCSAPLPIPRPAACTTAVVDDRQT